MKSLFESPRISTISKNSKKLFKKGPQGTMVLLASIAKSRLVIKKKKTSLISRKILEFGLEILVSFLIDRN